MAGRIMAILMLCFAANSAVRAEDTTIVRVEEDWELQIGSPDPLLDMPQIVTVFGPSNPDDGVHAVFELNHGTLPEFGEGGMQLQYWSGETLKGYRRQKAPAELSWVDEVIRFTTVTEIESGNLTLAVTNGTSKSFGAFGDENALRIQVKTTLDNLNDMSLENSIKHSRVTYGANHVQKFTRLRVRMLNVAGDAIATDSQVRDVR
jgi:hypothetical protein